MADLNIVSSSPHVRSSDSTTNIMRDVVIALIPATLVGFYIFGLAAVFTVLLSVASAVFFEYIYQKYTKGVVRINDYSSAVTGLLLGLNLPALLPVLPNAANGTTMVDFLVPFAIPILGSMFAIIVVKQLFGGLGNNFMNPALGARAFLIVSFANQMTTWPIVKAVWPVSGVDTVSSATILGLLKHDKPINASVLDAFVGTISGSIGEISALALIIGGIYLVVRKVISYRIPVVFIGTVAIFMSLYMLFSGDGFDIEFLGYQLFSGGLMLGAIFMATDYVTSPMTIKGQIIFAVGCGVITSFVRLFGGYPEGVSFAIIIMNLTVPLINRYTIPRCFGEEK
jgi:electron transport complex protein RnfD